MNELGAHFFRHEYARLVAILSRRVGMSRLEAVEDAVQSALATAVEDWPRSRVPDNPSAWLLRVAHNHLFGELRRDARRAALALRHADDALEPAPEAFLEGEVRDDLLRMLFVCCDDALPVESQLVLALKVLCGFDVREIAARLFLSEANAYKRLARARLRLREEDSMRDVPSPAALAARLPAVHSILYVLFTEGYLSAHADGPIRRELCDEAIRLATELASHDVGAVPETFALLALMFLHSARAGAREDASGGLVLLEEQDRSRWDRRQIEVGLAWLARSAEGLTFSRYHAEAGIAAEHCLAATFAATRWDRIVASYALLERVAPSPIHTLNRAVALAELQGPQAGLDLLAGLAPPSWLEGSWLWAAVLADLHRRAGNTALAASHRASAIDAAPSPAVRTALERRLLA